MMPIELSGREICALNRLGDLVLPGYKDLPAFSGSDCVQHISDILRHAPVEDIGHLRSLLRVLYYAPDFVLRFLVHHMEDREGLPHFLRGFFRKLGFGLRGVIFSCYYNEKNRDMSHNHSPLSIIGSQINRIAR
jgi:hypothetical protein